MLDIVDLRRAEVRRYKIVLSLRLLPLCERNFIAKGSGLATVEFYNQGLQSVAKKQEPERAGGSVYVHEIKLETNTGLGKCLSFDYPLNLQKRMLVEKNCCPVKHS